MPFTSKETGPAASRQDRLYESSPSLTRSSGHGGQTEDLDGDEDDGYDEVVYPVDFKQQGHIVDDESTSFFFFTTRNSPSRPRAYPQCTTSWSVPCRPAAA